ncbi:MAG: hypothetical protein ACI9R3_003601 [Verrucomicrobiales bacterium]|jgi:hypothetical protein
MNPRSQVFPILRSLILVYVCITWVAQSRVFANLQITELMAVADPGLPDADGAPSDWIEISNSGAGVAQLAGHFLTNNAGDLTRWTFPVVEIAPGASQIVFASGRSPANPDLEGVHASFTLDRAGDYLALVAPDGVTVLSEIVPAYPEQFEGISYGLGVAAGATREVLVGRDDEAKYLVAIDDSLGDTWKISPAEFDDSTWAGGKGGFGFETTGGTLEPMISTNISDAMRTVNASGYFRFPFRFDANDRLVSSLQLNVRIDDGFVAYLNGVEIGSFRKPADLQWNSTATNNPNRSDQEVIGQAIVIDVSEYRTSIIDGENVLAIQGMNSSAGGSDFAIDAELLADVQNTSGGFQFGYFEEPTPGAVNGTVKDAPPAEVEFSDASKLFTDSFQVALSSTTPDAVIRYTTDLSVPTNAIENPSPSYSGPIVINESTQIRARAFKSGALDGAVRTETFLKMADDVPTFSSDLPVIVVSTLGTGSPPDTSSTTRKTAFMFFFEPDPLTGRTVLTQSPAITTRAGVRRRGSSSGAWPKYSLSVETWRDGDDQDRTIEPLGMPREADWILNARFEWDLALMRNPFVYEVSRQIGRYAPRTRFVEVFSDTRGTDISDDDYFGVYSLIEKIEMDPNRVDIERIMPWENSEPEITGGYIFKNDRPDPGEPTINVRGMGQLTLVDPDGAESSRDQRSWLIDHLNELDRALGSDPEGINTTTGLHFSDYIDVDSWIDHHWLNIMVMNIDWGRHSAFFYKDRGGKIVCGPVWDYDRALGCEDVRDNEPRAWEGVVNAVGTVSSKTWFDSRFPWYGDLLGPTEDPARANYPDVRQRHTDRWFELRKSEFSIQNLHAIIDSMASEIREAQARNFERWTRYPPNGGDFAAPGLTGWEAEVSHMKRWLVARIEWLDSQYLMPPVFNNPGGLIPEGFQLVMSSPGGQVFYTTDGSDPRAPGGSLAEGAIPFAGGPVDETLIAGDAVGRYIVPQDDSLILTWTQAPDVFDDSTWTTATNGVGYESSGGISELISTSIESEMKSVNASCYVRLPFDFANTENLNSLTLTVWVDDGFVAYLNGIEVGSLLKPSPLLWNSTTDGGRGFPGGDSAVLDSPVVLDLTSFKNQVRAGKNVIALHGMNSSEGGSDFLVRATLSVNHTVSPTPATVDGTQVVTARAFDGSQWSSPEQIPLIISDDLADNTNLAVSEIMSRPSLPTADEVAAGFAKREEFEFLELLNISDTPVALIGMRFAAGVDFDFNQSPIILVQSGGRVLLVKNRAAFEFRYGSSLADQIIGEFENGTMLKNEGERLHVTALDGSGVRDFVYDDSAPWPVAPDQGGFSLVLTDPEANPDHGLAANWKLSSTLDGTPGTGEGLTFASWASAFGNPRIESDDDADGRVALVEYAMGSDPTIPDFIGTNGIPGSKLEIGEFLTFSFRRNPLADDITLDLEQSLDLDVWSDVDDRFALVDEINNLDGTTTLVYRSSSPQDNLSIFLRMRVTLR